MKHFTGINVMRNMSTNKFPTFQVRARNPKGVMTGRNIEILMDGQKLKGATALRFEVKAKSIAKISVDFYGIVDIEGEVPCKLVKIIPPDEVMKDLLKKETL